VPAAAAAAGTAFEVVLGGEYEQAVFQIIVAFFDGRQGRVFFDL
jgi:hypothetical protein